MTELVMRLFADETSESWWARWVLVAVASLCADFEKPDPEATMRCVMCLYISCPATTCCTAETPTFFL